MREFADETIGVKVVDIRWRLQMRCLVRLFFRGGGNVEDAIEGFRIARLWRIRHWSLGRLNLLSRAGLAGRGWTGSRCWRIFLYFFLFVNGVLWGFLRGRWVFLLRFLRRLLF